MKRFAGLAALLFLAVACWAADPAQRQLRIGSKRFTESYILAHLMAQTVARDTGKQAEIREGLGNTADGYKYVNVVRRRAFGEDIASPTPQPNDLTPNNTNNFEAAVLRERRYELAFEDDRWFDLKRQGKLLTNAELIKKGIKPYNVVLPIPQSERDTNKKLGK